ncbi:hypothetical protein HWV62_14088 [Athelia sp. TMB]|nr:hypothetical protein HWV62_14088 [Athelia sp. TMB]
MSTTTPGKPRQSGIPTPGRPSAIPTPGRSRASSSANNYPPVSSDVEYMSRAFADAIKANDPAKHRSGRASDVSSLQSSPPSSVVQSGRRSVAGRPPSVSSSSSAAPQKPTVERSRTPTARPASRQSDVFGRSVSRVGRAFEVGDNVRIESLGFEGTLRYLGEIDGKSGLFAGVELGGGFAGHGKNDGTVNGKQYFSCPPKCGVFVASTKLSAPTVGFGARPPSVASGRVTPSFSSSLYNGWTTSSSNGRVTPSFGHLPVTSTTPASRIRALSTVKTPTISSQRKGAGAMSQYASMTANPFGSRDASSSPTRGSASPVRSIPSPTRASMGYSSPTRSLTSPFNTPKPNGRTSNIGVGLPSSASGKGRPPIATPKARLPSGIAMPPPDSPAGPSRSVSLNDGPLKSLANGDSAVDLEANGRALQDKIAQLMSGKGTPSKHFERPSSVASVRSSSQAVDLQALVDQLQSRLDAMEYENQRLRDLSTEIKVDNAANTKVEELQTAIDALRVERDQAAARVTDLEAQTKASERSLDERNAKVESLERQVQQHVADLERQRADSEGRVKDLQAKVEDSEEMVKNLKEAIEAKEGLENQNDAVLKAKNAEIALLESRMQKTSTDWDQERKHLLSQVDELRQAGQETIALYEERLSTADTDRYALEDRISALEDEAKQGANSMSASRQASSAAEIDNETLRDQVQHMQKRIQTLEDMLEDAQAASEREEAATRERIRRFREKEDIMKKELNAGRVEVEQMLKSEESARGRVEENEEALRESTLALENARAEIEVLRAEIANLESNSSGTAQRGTGEPASVTAGLKQALEEARELKLLEDNVEQSLLREEEALNAEDARASSPGSADAAALQKTLKEQKIKYEMDLEQIRKRLTEAERHNRHADMKAQKEISELEALVESKIYREDELEQELEKAKEKLARAERKVGKSPGPRPRLSASSGQTSSSASDIDSEVCELCDQPGHDMFNCDGLPPLAPKSLHEDPSSLYCDDCDTHGHTTANCPHAMEVF